MPRPIPRPMLASLLALIALGLPVPSSASSGAGAEPLTTIAALDVPRYMGEWFEIARYENRFQRQCAGDTRAEYSLKDNGRLRVVNRCREEDGGITEAVGEARQIGGPTSPRLEVRFAPAWLSFIPAVWGDYWIVDLDPAYELVAISEPTRTYLWVLSRSPRVAPADYEALLQRLRAKGFDTDKLVRSVHTGA